MIALHHNTNNSFGDKLITLNKAIEDAQKTISVVVKVAFFFLSLPTVKNRVFRKLKRTSLSLLVIEREILEPDFVANKEEYRSVKSILGEIKDTDLIVKATRYWGTDKKILEILAKNIDLAYNIEKSYRKKLFSTEVSPPPSDLAISISALSQNTISEKIYAP